MLRGGDRGLGAYLVATATVAGGLVMALEVVGARVIGAFYGVSLFVWTSLIGVTLLALALGYVLGGRIADRMRTPNPIYVWLALAGLFTLAVPWLKGWVLPGAAPLGPRWGAFASALVLFGPPLALLGAVSPAIVRQLVSDPQRLGSTVGALFGWSTLGSLVGTLLAGYVLLVYFGLTAILVACGAVAIALSALYFAWFARRFSALWLLVVPLFSAAPPGEAEAVRADGTRVRVIAAQSGFYGEVRVVEYSHGPTRTREMVIDGMVQGGADMANGDSIYEFAHLLRELPLAHRPNIRTCLVVGLGQGLVPLWLHERGIVTEVVEIDPVVIETARQHFGFPQSVPVIVDDARHFLASGRGRYDCIVLDAFSGDASPSHLLSREAMLAAKARLAPEGVVALNIVATTDGASAAPVLATLERVFGHVRVYPVPTEKDTGGITNVIVLASAMPIAPLRMPQPWVAAVHPLARQGVEHALALGASFRGRSSDRDITDDHNPLDVQDAALKERVRQEILRDTSPQILLGRPKG